MFFSRAPLLPCSRTLLFVLLLCIPSVVHTQWESDVRLTFDPDSSLTYFNNTWCVASNGDTVHVVWFDKRDHCWEIYYKRSFDGGSGWGPDIRLTQDSANSYYPSVAVSGPEVHVVWDDARRGPGPDIFYKRSLDGGSSWSPDIRLTNGTNVSWHPSVAVRGSSVHVVWDDWRDGDQEIYYKRSTDAGSTWGPDVRLTYASDYSCFPSIALSDSVVHVAWEDLRGGNERIFYRRSTDWGTSWSADTCLSSGAGGSCLPSVAVSGPNVHVAWQDARDRGWPFFELYYKRSTDGGLRWGPDVRLTQDTACSIGPSLAVSGSNIHLAWKDNRDGNYEIYYKHSTDGGSTWGFDTRLTYDIAYSDIPAIAVSGVKVHVVWMDERPGNWEIFYKRNPTGNSEVEESSGSFYPLPSNLSFSVVPNPFTSFATLPGHEAERFALYDISGKRVGSYKGDRVGEGLPAGVYFLRLEGKGDKPLRVVKLR